MRVLHFIDSLEVGGAEAMTLALASHQVQQGWQVEIHCLDVRGVLADSALAAGIAVLSHAGLGRAARATRVWQALRKAPVDAVHCHNVAATVMVAPLAKLAGVRRILATRHGLGSRVGAWRREIKFWLAVRLSGAWAVAVCDAARAELGRGPAAQTARLVTIANGVAPSPAAVGIAPPGDAFVVVCVARLNKVKDHASLLRAVAIASAKLPPLRLRLVGDGPERGSLTELVASLNLGSTVEFLGERSDVGHCLAAAHLFALTSISEGLPLSLLEAYAAGLPAIVSDVGGMPQVVREADAGTVVAAGDVEGIAASLLYWASHPAERSAASARARQAFVTRHSIARMCREYDQLLDQGRLAA